MEIPHDRFLTGVLLFSKKIKAISPEQNIGLLLPSSAGGAITTMAALALGKTIVNLNNDTKVNLLHHPAKVYSVEEIHKLGSGKIDFGATKKIALAYIE